MTCGMTSMGNRNRKNVVTDDSCFALESSHSLGCRSDASASPLHFPNHLSTWSASEIINSPLLSRHSEDEKSGLAHEPRDSLRNGSRSHAEDVATLNQCKRLRRPSSVQRRRSDGVCHDIGKTSAFPTEHSIGSAASTPSPTQQQQQQRRRRRTRSVDSHEERSWDDQLFHLLNRIESSFPNNIRKERVTTVPTAMPSNDSPANPSLLHGSLISCHSANIGHATTTPITHQILPCQTNGIQRWNDEVTASQDVIEVGYSASMKYTESDVASVEGLPSRLQSKLLIESQRTDRDKILRQLDGIHEFPPHRNRTWEEPKCVTPVVRNVPSKLDGNTLSDSTDNKDSRENHLAFVLLDAANATLNFMLGISVIDCRQEGDDGKGEHHRDVDTSWKTADDSFALLGCAPVMRTRVTRKPVVSPSLVRVASKPPPLSFAAALQHRTIDHRLPCWVRGQLFPSRRTPGNGAYELGVSRTVVVHEIVRRAWTWCTAWSPSGHYLAVGTENHHLAVVDTASSTVWRVRHDQKLTGPVRNNTTHSIRSIAWGAEFIAIGGTGNAVSIIEPIDPFPIIHVIKNMGFVGALDWRLDSGLLVIGSRLGKAVLERVFFSKEITSTGVFRVESQRLHEIKCKNWVNCVSFSRDGAYLAVGDAGGILGIYSVSDDSSAPFQVALLQCITLDDSILSLEWSPNGKWLFAGGEDFHITVVDVQSWETVHRINRERWVQCISSSHGGTHLAVGGVSSEISILDSNQGWDSVMGIDLKGLVPLSANWHPKDQFLAISGQSDSIIAVETTNARHVEGHHLHSISPVLAISFSPDGRVVIVGNETGIVTYYKLEGITFETAYELVLTTNNRLSIQWSLNGEFSIVAGQDSVFVVRRSNFNSWDEEEESLNASPPLSAGFSIIKALRNLGDLFAVSIDPLSQYVAVSGARDTRFLDVALDFRLVQQFRHVLKGPVGDAAIYANAWAPDGRWFATIGQRKLLTVYDTGHERLDRWRAIFSLRCDFVGRALTWSPSIEAGLLYLAYGGDGSEITIMEIRTHEGTWETVLRIPRDDAVHDLDWNSDGLLAAAIGNGTVAVVDLSYLQSGVPVNEMDYDWQQQALTCVTEIRRNRGTNRMLTVRWIPSAPGSDSLLAVGGSDGEVEILDLTERRRCRGFAHHDVM